MNPDRLGALVPPAPRGTGRRALAEPGGLADRLPTGPHPVCLLQGAWGRPTRLRLPDGSEQSVQLLGKGHASRAYRGEDGWVYLLSSPVAADPAKELLVEVQRQQRSIYLPRIEPLGATRTGWSVYRMPWYPAVERGSEASRQGRALNACRAAALKKAGWTSDASRGYLVREAFVPCARAAVRAGKLPRALVGAVERLLEAGAQRGLDLGLEFPGGNLRSHPTTGKLILLDVVYDRQRLAAYRAKLRGAMYNFDNDIRAWGRRRRLPSVHPPLC